MNDANEKPGSGRVVLFDQRFVDELAAAISGLKSASSAPVSVHSPFPEDDGQTLGELNMQTEVEKTEMKIAVARQELEALQARSDVSDEVMKLAMEDVITLYDCLCVALRAETTAIEIDILSLRASAAASVAA